MRIIIELDAHTQTEVKVISHSSGQTEPPQPSILQEQAIDAGEAKIGGSKETGPAVDSQEDTASSFSPAEAASPVEETGSGAVTSEEDASSAGAAPNLEETE
jgi:hypothetical protein